MKGVGYRWDLENKGGRLSFQQIFLLPLISLSFGSIGLPSSYTLMFFSSLPYLNPHSSPVYFYSLSYTLVDRRLLLVYPTATFIFHIMLHSSAPLHLPPFSLLLHTYLPHFIPSISVHYTTRLFVIFGIGSQSPSSCCSHLSPLLQLLPYISLYLAAL